MISPERMAAVDRNSEALGVPQRVLMESSGNAIARTVRSMVGPDQSITILCGPGNNGGDGFVAGRFLNDYDVTVVLVGDPAQINSDIARANWDVLQATETQTRIISDSTECSLQETDLIVDALLGTGIRGALREPMASVAKTVNKRESMVLAVDIPTGMDATSGAVPGTMIEPDTVVTFHDRKPAHDTLEIPIIVEDIGIPSGAEQFVERGDLLGAFERNPESHKGDAGRIGILGGGPYTGAPALTAQAALVTGADLATVLCPSEVTEVIQGYSPELIVRSLPGDRFVPDHIDAVLESVKEMDCLVIGPGLGDQPATLTAVRELLESISLPCVVDADALKAVPDVDASTNLICTPHQGELEEMGGPREADWRERKSAVETFARELEVTFLVKGRYDIITDGSESRVNRTGNPGMTVGGTGDVLAGCTASCFAMSHLRSVQAASLGAFITGRAGDFANERQGFGLGPSDVIEEIPAVIWGEDHD